MIYSDEFPPIFNGSLQNINHEIPCTLSNRIVNWTVPSVVDNSGNYSLSSNYKPGDKFYLGETRVNYTATDASGNIAMDSFIVSLAGKCFVIIKDCKINPYCCIKVFNASQNTPARQVLFSN